MLKGRGWERVDSCVFGSRIETIDHLLFSCSRAQYIWRIVHVSFCAFSLPTNMEDALNSWVFQFSKRERGVVLVGFAAIIWVLWKTRNNACFHNEFPHDPSAVMFTIYSLLDRWDGLQKSEAQEVLLRCSQRLWRFTDEIFCRSRGLVPITMWLTG